jgi:hypothetical protein
MNPLLSAFGFTSCSISGDEEQIEGRSHAFDQAIGLTQRLQKHISPLTIKNVGP